MTQAGRVRSVTLLVLVLISITGSLCLPTYAAHESSAQAAIGLDVRAAFDGNYAPERWLPLTITLRNPGAPLRVQVAAGLPGATSRQMVVVELPGGAETSVPLMAAMDSQAREVQVQVSTDTELLAETTVPVRPRPDERLIGLVSDRPLSLMLPARQDLQQLPLQAFMLDSRSLPEHPAGLSSLSLIVINDLSDQPLSLAQIDALLAWVISGGHLVIGGGVDAAATLATLPAVLRLGSVGEPTELDPVALSDYTGTPASAVLEGVQLRFAPDVIGFGEGRTLLWGRRNLGLGLVTQLAFDPTLRAIANWPGAPVLWDRLLVPTTTSSSQFGATAAFAVEQTRTLASGLGYLPAISLPRSNLLFVLLAIYAIVIGPGVALILRRFDRQAWAWLVVPGIALLMLAVTSAIALNNRSSERIVSQLSVVEQIDGDTARVRSVMGLLSPVDDIVALSLDSAALVRPAPERTSNFGSVYGIEGDLAQDQGQIDVQIRRWEIGGLVAEEMVPLPALDAEILLTPEAIEVRVQNTTGQVLRNVSVVYAGQAVSLGDLPPGGLSSAVWPPPLAALTPRERISNVVLGEALAAGRDVGGQIDRRLLLRETLLNAGAEPLVQAADSGPLVLGWLNVALVPIDVDFRDAARQQVALLIARPRISGTGEAVVPTGWMYLDLQERSVQSCRANGISGVATTTLPVEVPLRLPSAMATFQLEQLRIDLASEREWPNAGVRLELYDWRSASWVAQDFDGPGSLELAAAGSYMQGGRILLRLDGRIAEAGCVLVDAQLRGTLPPQ
jgi:hypothetical protein